MELKNVIDRLMKVTGLNQTQLGEQILGSQSMVSKMRTGSDWEIHWQVIVRLIALCEENGIDYGSNGPARSGFKDTRLHGGLTADSSMAWKKHKKH